MGKISLRVKLQKSTALKTDAILKFVLKYLLELGFGSDLMPPANRRDLQWFRRSNQLLKSLVLITNTFIDLFKVTKGRFLARFPLLPTVSGSQGCTSFGNLSYRHISDNTSSVTLLKSSHSHRARTALSNAKVVTVVK